MLDQLTKKARKGPLLASEVAALSQTELRLLMERLGANLVIQGENP